MRTAERLGLILAGLLAFGAVATRPAGAHPVAQGALDIVVLPGRVSVTARVSMEELLVATAYNAATDGAATDGAATDGSAAGMVRRHGDYLLGHLRVFADERQLQGRVVRVAGQAVFGPTYELEYRGFDGVPGRIGVQQDVLREFEFAPGNPWEASYAVRVWWPGGPAVEALLLTAREPLVVDGSAVAEARRESSRHGQARMTGLIRQGLARVPSGSQQLLFIVALALAVGTWWGLVKVLGRGVVVTRAGHARRSMAAARFGSGRDAAVAAGRLRSGRHAAAAEGALATCRSPLKGERR